MKVNTNGWAVTQASWLPGWQWQAHTPEKILMGSAETEEAARAEAHAAAQTLGLIPKGSG